MLFCLLFLGHASGHFTVAVRINFCTHFAVSEMLSDLYTSNHKVTCYIIS